MSELSNITYMGVCEGNTTRDLAKMIDDGEITHAVVTYRTEGGSLSYYLTGSDDLTYLIGMVTRIQTHMHCVDSFFEIPGEDAGVRGNVQVSWLR